MPLFSQRKGLKPLRHPLQRDTVDASLRNLLWSTLHDLYFGQWNHTESGYGYLSQRAEAVRTLIYSIWCYHFKLPSDTVPEWHRAIGEIRAGFFKSEWNEVYDLVEYVAANAGDTSVFAGLCNGWLEQENSAYRLVANEVVEITSRAEMNEIETAASSGIHGVEKHISTALSFLSDRKAPDYRNCVKEAISAVETACRSFGGGTTLAHALKALKQRVEIHPAFERSLNALYGYTSDEGGIRHSLLDESRISFSDAKFMLVTCSAFANYLIGKAAESGIKLVR